MPLKGLTASSWANQLPFNQRHTVEPRARRQLPRSGLPCQSCCGHKQLSATMPMTMPPSPSPFASFTGIYNIYFNIARFWQPPKQPAHSKPIPVPSQPAQWPLLKPLRPMPHCVLLCQIVYEKLRMTPPPMEVPSMPSAHKSSRLGRGFGPVARWVARCGSAR